MVLVLWFEHRAAGDHHAPVLEGDILHLRARSLAVLDVDRRRNANDQRRWLPIDRSELRQKKLERAHRSQQGRKQDTQNEGRDDPYSHAGAQHGRSSR